MRSTRYSVIYVYTMLEIKGYFSENLWAKTFATYNLYRICDNNKN